MPPKKKTPKKKPVIEVEYDGVVVASGNMTMYRTKKTGRYVIILDTKSAKTPS